MKRQAHKVQKHKSWDRKTVINLFILICSFVGCSQKPIDRFERKNKHGLNLNPKGFRVEITSYDGRNEFHLSEPVFLNLTFAASKTATYTIEKLEARNSSSMSERYEIFPSDTVYYDTRLRPFSCCGSKREFLTSKPVSVAIPLATRVRFLKPGNYVLYVTTNQVFFAQSDKQSDLYNGMGPTITSPMIRLSILSDDPPWLAAQLAKVRAALNSSGGTTLFDACMALSWLDTSEAVEEKLRRIERSQPCGDPLSVAYSAHHELVVPRLSKLISNPGYPVTQALVEALATARALQEHPELTPYKAPFDTPSVFRLQNSVKQATLQSLPEIKKGLKYKRGDASRQTLETLKLLSYEYP